MAMLQADNGNYSPSIVALMSCHLHLSRGILHAQSHSPVGTSQEICDVSSQRHSPCQDKGAMILNFFPPMIFPKSSLFVQKSHIPNSVS